MTDSVFYGHTAAAVSGTQAPVLRDVMAEDGTGTIRDDAKLVRNYYLDSASTAINASSIMKAGDLAFAGKYAAIARDPDTGFADLGYHHPAAQLEATATYYVDPEKGNDGNGGESDQDASAEDSAEDQDTVNTTALYADVVENFIGRYGNLSFGGSDNEFYAQGVFKIDLKDFNQDGTDELMILYTAEENGIYPYIEIFTVEDGGLVKLFSQKTRDEFHEAAMSFCLYQNGGNLYVPVYDSLDQNPVYVHLYGFDENGEFGEVYQYEKQQYTKKVTKTDTYSIIYLVKIRKMLYKYIDNWNNPTCKNNYHQQYKWISNLLTFFAGHSLHKSLCHLDKLQSYLSQLHAANIQRHYLVRLNHLNHQY